MAIHCSTCNCNFTSRAALRHHRRSSQRHSPWPYCRSCDRKFLDRQSLTAHLSSKHKANQGVGCTIDHLGRIKSNGKARVDTTRLHCYECNRGFASEPALNQHWRDKVHTPKKAKVSSYCSECNKVFCDGNALNRHLASVVHHPIINNLRCIAGGNCRKTFTSPSAMIHHLESGSCSSGINRRRIDQIISERDTGNLITSGNTTQRIWALDDDTGASPSNSSMGGMPILALTHSNHSQIRNTNTSPSGALIPVSGRGSPGTRIMAPLNGKLSCPNCPPSSTRKFHTAQALLAHMASPAHAPKIYHCPLGLVAGGARRQKAKLAGFTTLSGLAQHLESGACRGGKKTFRKAVSFVNGRLREMGFADIKLIA